ncbi:MAG: COG1361 family protein [Minisyncoccota bacterium]
MQSNNEEDEIGSLERARESLYRPAAPKRNRPSLQEADERALPHAWQERRPVMPQGVRHVRLASIFFGAAALFFLVSLAGAAYFFYYGSNSVSVAKVSIDIQGPTTIAGGDTVPLSLTITNKNPVAIENATIEIDFPDGTRSATDVASTYPRYVENLGTLASGATVTRSIKAIVFGAAGQTLSLPVSFSYGTASSNAVFEKKSTYALAISSTPLSVSVDALTETVSGEPLTFTLTVRSNATVPLDNVVLTTTSPFGFSVTSSSIPLSNSTFAIGTLAPGATKQVRLTGTLTGQDNQQSVFHFTVGTAKSKQDLTPVVSYMTQDATVVITAPFIATTLSLNGDSSPNVVMAPGSLQNVSLSYTNTLPTTVTNATVSVSVAGSAIDYNSIKTTNGFYNSANHTIVFSSDTDPALASLAPGASGVGSFTFSTLSSPTVAPTVTFSISVSGTRVGQSNVPEQITSSATKVAKVATTVLLSSRASTAGPIQSSGPIPPRANQPTTYSIIWSAQNKGSAVAGGTVTATLPSYVSYTTKTSGSGAFSYDSVSRTVSWSTGDLAQGAGVQGAFQVSLTPSTSQKGSMVTLTSAPAFSGYDRFAGVPVTATAPAATTETVGDPGYVPANAIVQ